MKCPLLRIRDSPVPRFPHHMWRRARPRSAMGQDRAKLGQRGPEMKRNKFKYHIEVYSGLPARPRWRCQNGPLRVETSQDGAKVCSHGPRMGRRKVQSRSSENQANLMCRPIVGFIIHPSKKVSKLVRRLAKRRTNVAYFFGGGKMRPQWAVDEVTMG